MVYIVVEGTPYESEGILKVFNDSDTAHIYRLDLEAQLHEEDNTYYNVYDHEVENEDI